MKSSPVRENLSQRAWNPGEGEGRRVQKWGGGGSGLSRVVARVVETESDGDRSSAG